MNKETNWYDFDDGFSIGTSGPEGGLIVRDEEHRDGARITLEEDGSFSGFSVTCGIYGWTVHTIYFSEEYEADKEFGKMKDDLSRILELISETDQRDEEAIAAVEEEINEFVEKYP
jgi:hypothetical protein